jgi:hypothetical protein
MKLFLMACSYCDCNNHGFFVLFGKSGFVLL